MLKGMRAYADDWIVNGEIWHLKFKNKIDEDGSLGECDPSTKTCYIKTGQTRQETAKVLFHEFIHAAEEEYNFELKHYYINKLEEFLYHFILDNFSSLEKIFSPRNSRKK